MNPQQTLCVILCEECGQSFTSRGALCHHQQSVHEGRTFRCKNCQKSYTRNCSLQYHYRHNPACQQEAAKQDEEIQTPARPPQADAATQTDCSVQTETVGVNTEITMDENGIAAYVAAAHQSDPPNVDESDLAASLISDESDLASYVATYMGWTGNEVDAAVDEVMGEVGTAGENK